MDLDGDSSLTYAVHPKGLLTKRDGRWSVFDPDPAMAMKNCHFSTLSLAARRPVIAGVAPCLGIFDGLQWKELRNAAPLLEAPIASGESHGENSAVLFTVSKCVVEITPGSVNGYSFANFSRLHAAVIETNILYIAGTIDNDGVVARTTRFQAGKC